MKKTILIALLGLSVANAGKNLVPAISEPIPVPIPDKPLGLYIGAGLTYANSTCSCKDIGLESSNEFKSNNLGLGLSGGYSFNKNLGIEAKYIYIPQKDEKRGLDHYGLYLRPSLPLTKKLDIYGLIGYGKTTCTSQSESFKGLGWGVGAEYTFNQKKEGLADGVGVYLEYLRPIKKSGAKNVTINIVDFGLRYHF